MGRSGSSGNHSRLQHNSGRDGSDNRHAAGERHGGHRHDQPDWDLRGLDVDLNDRRDGIDLEIDVDRHGRWLEIEIEWDDLIDIDLELDIRLLQPDETPMSVVIGGEGNAIGDETLVDASIFTRVVDLGSITIAFGVANFESIAVSDDDLLFASAMTFAEVAGADFVFVVTQSATTSRSGGHMSYAREESTTQFVAVDFEEFDFAGGPLVIDYADATHYLGHGGRCDGPRGIQIDGNVAQLEVDALAKAQDTLVDVTSSLLTVEDQLSSVSALVVTAGG
jgi:hypothetical protein